MKILEGKHLAPADATALATFREKYGRCLVDLGTGDALYPYRWAREHPEDMAVALDPVTTGFAKLAVKARRRLAKGGAPNLLFAAGAVEDLPGPFADWADEITVNFPWGSLLRALILPVPGILEKIACLARPGAEITLLLNTSVFHDPEYVDRLGMPPLTEERAREELVPAYAAAGIRIVTVDPLVGSVPHRTSWGQRLVLGSSRSTLMLRGYVREEDGEPLGDLLTP